MKKKTVIVAGCDGYIGHPLTLRLLELGYKVIGIDDFQRRNNVAEMGSFSATEIQEPIDRHFLFDKIGDFRFTKLSIDIDYDEMLDELKDEDPIAIVNLAQQPSAPFSFKSKQHAQDTTINNLIGTLNILYYMKEFAPNAQLIQIGSMGEYDPAMGTSIAEGTFDFEYKGSIARNVIFPRRPGSIYHLSKCASTYYIDAACRWWGLTATDIMQGVVYGNWTPEIEKYGSHTRLDSDESFGTCVNRFVVQALLGEPMTIFGEGLHSRGYLAINDSVQCLMLAIENPPNKGQYRTWNQLDRIYTPVSIAGEIAKVAMDKFGMKTATIHIDSPRVEKTSYFPYNPDTKKLKILGFEPTRTIADEVEYVMGLFLGKPIMNEIYPLRDVVMPLITWR